MANRKKDIGPCEYCKDSEEYEYHYWHGDIEEDYDMVLLFIMRQMNLMSY